MQKQLESVADSDNVSYATHSIDIPNSDRKNEASSPVSSAQKTEEDKIVSMSNKRFICILVTLAIFSVAAIACFVFLFVSETAAPVQLSSGGNESALTMLYLQQLDHSLSSLSKKVEIMAISNSQELSALHDKVEVIASNNSQDLSELQVKVKAIATNNSLELAVLHRQIEQNTLLINESGLSRLLPVSSCAALPPSSLSGYYWVRATNGSAVHVYCDMTRSCGGVTGGWMRVAKLNTTDSSQQCPSGLMRPLGSGSILITTYVHV